jgi:hypothetical protein
MTLREWQEKSRAASERARSVAASIIDRARETARLAGLDGSMPFLHAHNALCGLHYGQPWSGVDYSLARKVLWLEEQSWKPGRLADAYSRRIYEKIIY